MKQVVGWFVGVILFASTSVQAEIREETVTYDHAGQTLNGYLVWDDAASDGARPGVLVAHEWWGLNDYARKRARMLAEQGYVAFALDMYGEDRVTGHPDQASEWMKQITNNVDRWQDRAQQGLEVLRERPEVDRERIAAIGYCFGGATVLQLAYTGAPLDVIASFHGSLPVPSPEQSQAIDGHVFIAHGADDGFVPEERVDRFRKALDAGEVDWFMSIYGGARHSFTNPEADAVGMDNLAYDEAADRRSWSTLLDVLDEAFATAPK